METLDADTKSLVVMSPAELGRRLRDDRNGNMPVFLNSARGLMSHEEADAFSRLIEESCERIDE